MMDYTQNVEASALEAVQNAEGAEPGSLPEDRTESNWLVDAKRRFIQDTKLQIYFIQRGGDTRKDRLTGHPKSNWVELCRDGSVIVSPKLKTRMLAWDDPSKQKLTFPDSTAACRYLAKLGVLAERGQLDELLTKTHQSLARVRNTGGKLAEDWFSEVESELEDCTDLEAISLPQSVLPCVTRREEGGL